jgi:hypothetical protein
LKNIVRKRNQKTQDIIGKAYGCLTPIKRTNLRQHRHAIYNCYCSVCDGYHKMRRDTIVSGTFKCKYWSHGMSYSLTYRRYKSAHQRCTNPNHSSYKYYGQRGVRFKFKNFPEFYEWMGPCPGSGYQVGRLNDQGHYEVGNCYYMTTDQQNETRRMNHLKGCNSKTR